MASVKFKKALTKAQYDALETKDANALYFLEGNIAEPNESDVRLILNGKDYSGVKKIETGTTAGTIKVDGVDIAVKNVGDVTSKADKVNGATNGNFAGLDANGNLTDSGSNAATFATAAQGGKADTAVQSVKISGSETELKDGTNVVLPAYPTTLPASDVYDWAKAATKPSYTASEVGAIDATAKGTANGVAELDANGKVPSSQLPSYVDDVIEYAGTSAFPAEGESGKIYVDTTNNTTYRWSGSQYTQIKGDLVIGTTTGTAADGGTVNTHVTDTDIHVTTSDKTAWNAKYDKPSGGIPSTDMSDAVQASLALADSAIQSHQDITGKADKVSGATNGNFAALDSNGNLTDSGAKASDFLTSHQDISGKADKDTDAVEGNFAAFDANGNPVDSGTKASDFLTSHQDITGKADKVASATSGNFAGLDSNGNLTDSGKKAGDFVEGISIDNVAQTKTNGVINLPAYPTKASLNLNNVTNDAQVKRTEMGVANGVATLGNDGKVPAAQLPSYVDDVVDLVVAYAGVIEQSISANVGDILWSDMHVTQFTYSNRNYIRPTSDGVIPIGICVNEGDTVKFMSVKRLESLSWGPDGVVEGINDNSYDGNGLANMQAVISTGNLEQYPAFYQCHQYAPTGTSAGDWYLPSIDELRSIIGGRSNKIGNCLYQLYHSDYASYCDDSSVLGYRTWSSTQHGTKYAYTAWYDGGVSVGTSDSRGSSLNVRPMIQPTVSVLDTSHIYSDSNKTTEITPDADVIYKVSDGTNITYMKWNGSAYEVVTLEKGKIYVGTDDDKTYRYTGSTVVEISASPGSTDAVAEGSTNLYFTTARAEAVATAAINALDATETQTAGADGLSLSITQVDGVITSISGGIASGTYDASGSAAAVLGTSSDASTANTVYGAKAYADSLASNYDAAGSAASVAAMLEWDAD